MLIKVLQLTLRWFATISWVTASWQQASSKPCFHSEFIVPISLSTSRKRDGLRSPSARWASWQVSLLIFCYNITILFDHPPATGINHEHIFGYSAQNFWEITLNKLSNCFLLLSSYLYSRQSSKQYGLNSTHTVHYQEIAVVALAEYCKFRLKKFAFHGS